MLLESKGCEVVEAENGAEGLETAAKHLPDLIISDGLMPKMDGFHFLRELKKNEALKFIPFVFYSALYTGDTEKDLALSLGANAFIFKPRELNALWEDLSVVLRATGHANRPVAGTRRLEKNEEYLQKYSHVVALKLEEKVRELEQEVRERARAEERLLALSRRLAEAEEQERRSIARELHDQVGQNLTALGINLNILRARAGAAAEDALSRIDDSLALVEQTTERVRSVMTDLRPPVLDDYGLGAAIQWYCKQFSYRTGIPIAIEAGVVVPRVEPGKEIALFRVLQEALTNATKHSRATRIIVQVQITNGVLRMIVSDNGVGFNIDRFGSDEKAGWGLQNMQERARMIGGAGASVIVEAPL
jgi:signal transduction histidine kinase